MRGSVRWIGRAVLFSIVAVAPTGCFHGEEGPAIAFLVAQNEGPARIAALTEEGKEVWAASAGEAGLSSVPPAWSPDGKRLAFVRYRDKLRHRSTRELRKPEVVVIDADGSDERVVGEGTRPSWTADGRSLVVARRAAPGAPSIIYVLDADGDGERRLTTGSEPAVSHGGSTVAFIRSVYGPRPDGSCCGFSSSSIYTIGLDGSGLRRIAQVRDPDGSIIRAVWLPDDSAVAALLSRRAAGGALLVYSVGGERRVVARGVGTGAFGPAISSSYEWSAQGDLVAYLREGAVYVVRADGTEVTTFPGSTAIDLDWSSDGRKLAFSQLVLGESGQSIGLYVAEADAQEPQRIAFAEGDTAFLEWRPKS
jgi:Tol biopolymer transport system component